MDWKKELEVWQVANTVINVEKKIQACVLFESLEGIARQTVLSELTVAEITAEEGVKNITSTLDFFFIGNETQKAYDAIDDILNYRRDKEVTMEKFVVEFQLKVSKVKASGTVLPEGVLGYTLLNCANLPEEKHDMIKATCDVLTYKNVKAQLEKIGFAKSTSKMSKFSVKESESPRVKIESCFYGDGYASSSGKRPYNDDSSDEDLCRDQVFYSEHKSSFGNSIGNQYGNNAKKFKMNPTDRHGHVRACSYCKCLYHWLIDCPYAPSSSKNLKYKDMRSNKTL